MIRPHSLEDSRRRMQVMGGLVSMLSRDPQLADRRLGDVAEAQFSGPVRHCTGCGARVAFGSDWFVAPPTPLEGIYAAVTRRTLDDRNPGGWVPEQKIGVEDALRAYTTGAAYASFEENVKGIVPSRDVTCD